MSWNRRFPIFLAGCLVLCTASAALAEVSLTDRQLLVQRHRAKASKPRHPGSPGFLPNATGSQALIDASGMKWFIDTNITFSTSSSASGSASEASYTHAVAASTMNGGTTMETLNDAFDGYGSLCVSLTGAMGPCATGNAAYNIYNKRGPATTECGGRQIVFPAQTIGALSVSRKMYVPANDSFGRWFNVFTNTSGAPVTFNMVTSNNLGSDSNTRIVSSSDGNNTAEVTDTWVTSFQNFSGTTSTDPRLGHVFQGTNRAVGLAGITFVDGNDKPFWSYTLTLAPGETKAIATFAVAQPTKAAANAKAAQIAAFPASAQQCLSTQELSEVANFRTGGYYTINPCRLADTRSTDTPALSAGATRTFQVTGKCSVPTTATAIVLNVTETLPTADGHLTLAATGTAIGGTSTLNYSAGQTRANNGVYRLGNGGQIDIQAAQATGTLQLILDVSGYFVE